MTSLLESVLVSFFFFFLMFVWFSSFSVWAVQESKFFATIPRVVKMSLDFRPPFFAPSLTGTFGHSGYSEVENNPTG